MRRWAAFALMLALAGCGGGKRAVPPAQAHAAPTPAHGAVPWMVRVELMLLLGYLVSPIDLIPDFIPVIGFLDDAVVVAIMLRIVVRTAGPQMLQRHWPGTPQGLGALCRICGVAQEG